MFPIHLLVLLAAGAQAAVLTLQSPRFTVSSAGSQIRSEPISLVQKPSTPVTLSKDDVLKVTFQVIEKESGKGVQPHQTFLRFYDPKSGEEGIQPVRVTNGGKAKFELNMAKPPLSLPPTTDSPLKVTLLIGSPLHSPLAVSLFDLIVPASQPPPVHPDEASFHLLPEIHHTFRPAQKLPPKAISAIFSAVVLAPWVILLGLWAQVAPRVPNLFSPSIFPFILTLGAFEGLLVWYWVDLKLPQVLAYGAVLGLVTLFTGKQALSKIGDRRVGRK
ncbi:Dolichyl-diphosphooligosaccharide--protein glycosyltransferase subunit 2 [Hypsizygus marmoreus]|uniref:Ribophorin II n=1 Tax=Hypsizygus marmoreus TaxID=39966 RepID=A0A369KGI7_HYPMA|nr:Dolichyl-diphosphooligosaccharide--protein glycosyltransferase subunit 2 [Hypsizygus marmoreus]